MGAEEIVFVGFFGMLFLSMFFLSLWEAPFRPKPEKLGTYSPDAEFSWADENTNSFSKAKEWAKEDIAYANERIMIVTNKGRNVFWGEEVADELRNAKERGVDIVFIIGPNFNKALHAPDWPSSNSCLIELAKEGVIELRVILKEHPCAGLRLIDDDGTYTCEYFTNQSPLPEEDNRNFIRTWHLYDLSKRQRKIIDWYYRNSVPALPLLNTEDRDIA